MTQSGVIHLCSAIYLAAMLCLAVSINENRKISRIARETARRFGKFMGICLVIAIAVYLLD